jgi:hypothetical protein
MFNAKYKVRSDTKEDYLKQLFLKVVLRNPVPVRYKNGTKQ